MNNRCRTRQKNMSLREEEQHSSPFLCEEQQYTLEEEDSRPNSIIEGESESDNADSTLIKLQSLPFILLDNDEEFFSLISKQRLTHFYSNALLLEDAPRRYDAVLWISKVSLIYGFTALTTVLAVNYFDRFITTLRFQMDKPWMTQLTAVACLSLAAKMEETHVPLLLDLQVGESRFVFEAKSIQRMELLVLSTLKWRMNPVTSISFFEHIVRRFGMKSPLHSEFLWRCERVLLSVIADSTVMSFLPSTLAAATMIHAVEEIDQFNAIEYRTQLLALLKTTEEHVNKCYKLILKLLSCYEGVHNLGQKRKCLPGPSISCGSVTDVSFSSDSSNDSWTVAPSVWVEPMFKKSKVQDQRMWLPSLNCVSIDVLNSPP
ncbi:hypothetical protein Lal_00027756 [Lupinus albus]|uniref:B-like cyclin n=1 Tax=Lupinus albus TaxID=3870 RepID=A0A6A4QHZ2_LUPAL|nr:putative cyclin [Lupinus albus]KAF1873718.1 hypothetical protein Lal_00027756 [Lupinus albus]